MLICAYTQHESTVRVIESTCNVSVVRLRQDRSRDAVEDVLSQLPQNEPVLLYAVMPLDKAVQLRMQAPWIRLRILQLDGRVIEQVTGRPYDPKADYGEVVRMALKVFEIKSGNIRYLTVDEFLRELEGKKVAVFNDVVREAIRLLGEKVLGRQLDLVKVCDSGDCVEVNPLGHRSGYRISFPPTAGRLSSEQMVELILKGEARIYYLEVAAEEVPLCSN